jgi:MYXO-CTERM domain-containing protein
LLEGGCEVQWQEPAGALLCNGQYVHASDVTGCIDYLVTQGVQVDVSATASASCNGGDCNLDMAADGGCAASPAQAGGAGGLVFVGLLGIGYALVRRRR